MEIRNRAPAQRQVKVGRAASYTVFPRAKMMTFSFGTVILTL